MIVDVNILITLPDMPSYVHHFSQITEDDPENQNNYKDFKSLKLTLSYIVFKRSHFDTPHLKFISIWR